MEQIEQVQRFEALYTGLKRAYGHSKTGTRKNADGKLVTRSQTVTQPITTDRYKEHISGEAALGVVPIREDSTCYFGAIDIDEYDGLDHAALAKKIESGNLPLMVCRSKSGGAHVYVFFREPTEAEDVRTMLMRLSISLGQPGVEIFPKQVALASEHDVGNWINLPYFGGNRTAVDSQGNDLTLGEFLTEAENKRVDGAEDLATESPSAFADGPPCLQQLSVDGAPNGSRNNALLHMGVYVQRKYPEDWEEMLDKYNQDFMAQPLPSTEVSNTIGSLRKKDYGYKCKDEPMVSLCSRELCMTRKFGIQPGSFDEDGGVQIDGITVIETDPPIWFVNVSGASVQLTTDELMDQGRFRKRVLERTRVLMGRIKPKDWDAIIQQKLVTVEPIAAPPDASETGQLREYLDAWLSDGAMGEDFSELLLGMPVIDGSGFVYFRSKDFYEYLQRHKFTGMTKPAIYAALRGHIGIHHKGINVQGKFVNVWYTDRPTVAGDVPAKAVDDEAKF